MIIDMHTHIFPDKISAAGNVTLHPAVAPNPCDIGNCHAVLLLRRN